MFFINEFLKTVHDKPEAIMCKSAEQSMTYREVYNMAVKVSNCINTTIESKGPVIVYTHKQIESFSFFLGVVFSGRAYIPVDTSTPLERVESILVNAECSALIDLSNSSLELKHCDYIITLDCILNQDIENNHFKSKIDSEDTFYIIYTSGSSGLPKGVPISAANLDSYLQWACKLLPEGIPKRYLNVAPFSFDLSVGDTFLPVFMGGTFYSVTKEKSLDLKYLIDYIISNKITVWNSTPSFIQYALHSEKFDKKNIPSLAAFTFCGEVLKKETCKDLISRFPDAIIFNLYGPTESTMAVTAYEVKESNVDLYESIPIGCCKDDCLIYLDKEHNNEILICGKSLFHGYIGECSDGCFTEKDGLLWYRTGDKGEKIDNLLFCNGRIDNQVKINGHRIELGDIEANIVKISLIKDVVVVRIEEDVSSYLKAFIQLVDNKMKRDITTVMKIKKELRNFIPDYMIPRKIVFIDEFPMNENGKINRKILRDGSYV